MCSPTWHFFLYLNTLDNLGINKLQRHKKLNKLARQSDNLTNKVCEEVKALMDIFQWIILYNLRIFGKPSLGIHKIHKQDVPLWAIKTASGA